MDPKADSPQDLQDAIRLASEHLGVEYEAPDVALHLTEFGGSLCP